MHVSHVLCSIRDSAWQTQYNVIAPQVKVFRCCATPSFFVISLIFMLCESVQRLLCESFHRFETHAQASTNVDAHNKKVYNKKVVEIYEQHICTATICLWHIFIPCTNAGGGVRPPHQCYSWTNSTCPLLSTVIDWC